MDEQRQFEERLKAAAADAGRAAARRRDERHDQIAMSVLMSGMNEPEFRRRAATMGYRPSEIDFMLSLRHAD